MATRSSGASVSSSSLSELTSSGSLLGSSIEPEESTRNTRFAGGRASGTNV